MSTSDWSPAREAGGSPGTYDASAIQVLTGLEAVRRRPAMYVGSTTADALQHLVFEAIDNAVDEALAGYCHHIDVTIHADDSCTVQDDGRGIPVDIHPATGRPAAELVMTTLHAGAKFGRGGYHVAGGLHGVGISCVNALSDWLRLDIWRDGRHWHQDYARGAVTSDLADQGPTEQRGTAVHFLPDASIFDVDARLAFEGLSRRARELSYLLPGVTLHVRDLREGHDQTHRHEGGLSSFVYALNDTRVPIHPQPIVIDGEHKGVQVRAALQWTSLYAEDTRSFANTISTVDGGTHLAGLRAGIAAVVKRLDKDLPRQPGSKELKLRASDTREGLTCVLSVMLQDPRFMGQTKTRLADAAAEEAVRVVVEEQLAAALASDVGMARVVVDKARSAARARASARRARERIQHSHRHMDIDEEAYKTQFGIRSKNWHQSAEWIANDDLLAAHAAMCKVPPTAHLLDVCCGSGVVGNAFKDKVASTTGLDITPEMVGLSSERLDKVIQGTVFDLPFADNSYDIVVNREVMHLFPRPQDMLREVFRVLKPGGQFVFGQIVPFAPEDAAWMYRIFIKKQPLLHHMFMAEDLLDLLGSIGFGGIETSEHLLWESIDVWIDTWETTRLHRHEIRELFYNAPAEVRAVHPFEITSDGHIRDLWRWVIFSCWKPPLPEGAGDTGDAPRTQG